MRKKTAQKVRKACRIIIENYPELIPPEQEKNFYRYAKKAWKEGKWETLRKELEESSLDL